MAKRAVRRDATVINPMFSIPEGVDELVYDEGTINIDSFEEGFDEGLADDYIDDDYADADSFETYDDEPDAPGILAVLSQVLRASPTGNQVVDVVIEVEDIVGAESYEVRVTKA